MSDIADHNIKEMRAPAPRPLKTRLEALAEELGAQADSVVIIATERAGGSTHHHSAGRGNHYALVESVRAFLRRVED